MYQVKEYIYIYATIELSPQSAALKTVSRERKRLMTSRYKETEAQMYWSQEYLLMRLSVSYMMYPQNIIDARHPQTISDSLPSGNRICKKRNKHIITIRGANSLIEHAYHAERFHDPNTCIRAKTMRTSKAPNKKGPKKLKSWPLLAAQKVQRVRLNTTTVVNITDSRMIFPVSSFQPHQKKIDNPQSLTKK